MCIRDSSGKKIAIIGGGPAGLAAAFYARLEGHAVKIYEAQAKTGGMLRYGIPSYRLPRNVLEDELNILWRMGVELETNVRLGVDFLNVRLMPPISSTSPAVAPLASRLAASTGVM